MTVKATPVKEAWEDYVDNDPNSLKYPKRLIEVDLPIARISAHARREKSIRHGHISTLHIWWARRPLAACRAVICASLWPDPADPLCPPAFREAAVKHIKAFAARAASGSLPDGERPKLSEEQAELERGLSPESRGRWEAIAAGTCTLDPNEPSDMGILRFCLLDFIADFANWDNSSVEAYLVTSEGLTMAASESLGGIPGTKPLVVDPFAGGGSIPLEALRVGADSFASDLNPIPILLNTVALNYIPQFGKRLSAAVHEAGLKIEKLADEKLSKFYPKSNKGETSIAYLWMRVATCEGPSCGASIPLTRSLWLAKKGKDSVALRILPNKQEKTVGFEIISNASATDVGKGTIQRGAVTCPCCNYTTPVESIREQFRRVSGGADSAILVAIRFDDIETGARAWRLANNDDRVSAKAAIGELATLEKQNNDKFSLVPNEKLPPVGTLGFRVQNYGMLEWGNLFTSRQALSLITLGKLVRDADLDLPADLELAVRTCLALAIDRLADFNASLCVLNSVGGRGVVHVFGRQALPMVWDFMETNPFNLEAANWRTCYEVVDEVIEKERVITTSGTVSQASAAKHPLPNDSAAAFITDPPYYDSVPYADLSDFFYVWLRRNLPDAHRHLITDELTSKADECIVDPVRKKGKKFFEEKMTLAMAEGRRICMPNGIGVVVFAHKSTDGWETQIQAMLDAGWVITGSWPIDTERPGRLRAQDSAALASSVHLVCRPRENADGSLYEKVGDWRDVLSDLPKRIHQWMPRLTSEGVVGADAIFACLGPALEIFSKYSRVEKSNGDAATLREYLEHVWAAVSTEALALIFKDADASGLEPDARLTAMWMWTLGGGNDESGAAKDEDGKVKPSDGYTLEFDAARKIAQGLGVHLEQCTSFVEINGDKARLLPVSARTRHLFGNDSSRSSSGRSAKAKQATLFDDLDDAESADAGWTQLKGPPPGSTTLDRVHQAMILFAANRGELLKRFLVDDGVGKEARFWKLADNLNKLYPTGTEERRWVEGVLARKRGLGL